MSSSSTASSSRYNNSSSIYDPTPVQVDSSSSTPSPARPYVSAIRKRRTLFSDGFDPSSGSENESTYTIGSPATTISSDICSMPRSATTSTIYSNQSSNNNARSRPLSIVSEEANNNNSLRHVSANPSTTISGPEEEKGVNRTLPRPAVIKKSNSVSSATVSSVLPNSVTVPAKIRSTSTTTASSNSSVSSKPSSGETNGGTTVANRHIKVQNEIAFVTSMMPKSTTVSSQVSIRTKKMIQLLWKNRNTLS